MVDEVSSVELAPSDLVVVVEVDVDCFLVNGLPTLMRVFFAIEPVFNSMVRVDCSSEFADAASDLEAVVVVIVVISASDPVTSSELELWKDTDSVLTTGISIVMMLILSIFSFSSVTVSVFDPVLTLDWTTASPSIMEVVIVVTSSESDSVVGLAVD